MIGGEGIELQADASVLKHNARTNGRTPALPALLGMMIPHYKVQCNPHETKLEGEGQAKRIKVLHYLKLHLTRAIAR